MVKAAQLKVSVAVDDHAASDAQEASVVEIVVDTPLSYCNPLFDSHIIKIAIIETT